MGNADQALVFNVQKFSIHDGPGIRTTIFFKGCSLRCRWCANPESQNVQQELVYNQKNCLRCHACVAACKNEVIRVLEDGSISIDYTRCDLSADCIKACVPRALYLEGRFYTLDELLEVALSDTVFYDKSGGGVTLSGGEPLLQTTFILAFLKRLRAEGIHSTVESCGQIPSDKFALLLPWIDLIYFDVKHPDPAVHKAFTGADNKQILANLDLAAREAKDLVVRIAVIPGFNDDEEALKGFIKLFQSLAIQTVHLLPFHQYGLGKYELLGRAYAYKNTTNMEKDELEPMRKRMEQAGFHVQIGG